VNLKIANKLKMKSSESCSHKENPEAYPPLEYVEAFHNRPSCIEENESLNGSVNNLPQI
jgi:hypothetical protein